MDKDTIIHSSSYVVTPIDFPQGEEYVSDIELITVSGTGIIDAQITNMTLNESCIMLVNAIKIFRLGYFDCAFYSLRQTIELSIGGIYLFSDKNKIVDWNNGKNGFEKGTMTSLLLKDEKSDYKDVRDKLKFYFDNLRSTQQRIDKYVHKQGFTTFYTYHGRTANYYKKHTEKLTRDFEKYLKECIGAIAIYRLVIDPLPILLMDDDIEMRTPDFITEPFGQDFINKYIPGEVINAYKKTNIYQGYYIDLSNREKQNDSVYGLIHWQSINRNLRDDYVTQAHLLSMHDKLALTITFSSYKVSNCYLMDGCLWYHTEVDSKRGKSSITIGNDYFQQFFVDDKKYNQPFENVYISKCCAFGETHYFEHNEPLVEQEIALLEQMVSEINRKFDETNTLLQEWYNEQIKQHDSDE